MKNLRQVLRNADPLEYEPPYVSQRSLCRQRVLATAADARSPVGVRPRSRIKVLATALVVIAAFLIGAITWSLFNRDLQGAIRFEVRLAEDKPAPGLREAKVSGSDRSIYLHDEVVVTNGDIAVARVIPGRAPSEYGVSVEFTASGAKKMRAATQNHIGKTMAILLDGQVVVAAVIRTVIGEAAEITGKYSRTQAERIVKGIGIQ